MLGIFGSYSIYNYFATKKIQENTIQVHSRTLRDKINSNLVKKYLIFSLFLQHRKKSANRGEKFFSEADRRLASQ